MGTNTNFLFDGVNSVQEVIGGTNTANSLTGGIDEVFQRTDSAGARNYLTDDLGSTLALADGTGTVQTSYTFEPFGNTAGAGSGTTNSFAYTARELDSTGLYFYRARYYNAQLQRFTSEDPIGLGGGTNLYRYVSNDPLDFLDPFGLKDYSEQETLDWLKRAYNDSTAGPIQGLQNINRHSYKRSPLGDTSTGAGDFDFQNNVHSNDTWTRCGRKMQAAQFGNYIAGFEGASYDHNYWGWYSPARSAVEAAGIYFHFRAWLEPLRNWSREKHDPWDDTGRPDIRAGEQDGWTFAGRGGGCGCNH